MAVFDASFFPIKDFAVSLVATAPSPATTGTSLVVTTGEGALFPAPATAGAFRAYIWAAGSAPTQATAEEVEVTAISTDTFTIVRAKNGVTRTVVVGDYIAINFGKSKEDQILDALKNGSFEDKLLPGESYSRDSTTQFKTPGDKTLWYTAGRILRINNAGSYTNHTVVSSSYGAPDTTVTVKGTNLPAALTNIYLSLQTKGKTTTVDDVDTLTNKTLTTPVIASMYQDAGKTKLLTVPDTASDTLAAIAAAQTLTNKTYQLTAAPADDHTASGMTIQLKAHENVAFGDVCFINSDGEAALIDADAVATMNGVCMAIATINANDTGAFLLKGIARDDSWNWTVGGFVYGSVTGTSGNTLSQTAPSGTDDVVQILGVATHADRMYFNPSPVLLELV